MKLINCNKILWILGLSFWLCSCKKNDDGANNPPNSTSSTIIPSSSTARYTQNCVLETYTGLWCHNCPTADKITESLVSVYGNLLVPIDVHYGGDIFIPYNTDLYKKATMLVQSYQISSYPAQILNRDATIGVSSSKVATLVTPPSSTAISSTVGLEINSSTNNGILPINVKVRSAKAQSGIKLVVYAVENGILATHMTDAGEDPNYINDNVLQAIASDPLGDAIPDQTAAFEYAKTYQVPILTTPIPHPRVNQGPLYSYPLDTPTPAWVISNLRVVAMVVDSKNHVLNAQQAPVGKTQQFQILTP